MSLFRCAACGSQKVSVDTQAAGIKYDFVKGAVGTVLLGAGGAVAGVTNKEQRVYKCSDCGMTLTYPMPDEIKRMIDEGITFSERRNNLLIDGIPISWAELKKLYKNIELGYADEELEEKVIAAQKKELRGIDLLKSKGSASEEEFENAIRMIPVLATKFGIDKDYFWDQVTDHIVPFSRDNLPSLADYLSFLSALDIFFTNYFRFRPYEYILEHDRETSLIEMEVFKVFLITYFSMDFYNKTGQYAYVIGDARSTRAKPFIDFIKKNGFFMQLLLYYIKHVDRNDLFLDDYEEGNISYILERCSSPSQTRNCLVYPCNLFNIKEIVLFPKYQIKNGALYFNDLTFLYTIEKKQVYDYPYHVEKFFRYFPDKKEKYDSEVFEHHHKSFEIAKEKKNVENNISDAKNRLSVAEKKKFEYNTELNQLNNKIFGKKKSEARIRELNTLIIQQNTSINNLKAYISEEMKKIETTQIESEEAFSSRMYEEYDYYLVWCRIPEEQQQID